MPPILGPGGGMKPPGPGGYVGIPIGGPPIIPAPGGGINWPGGGIPMPGGGIIGGGAIPGRFGGIPDGMLIGGPDGTMFAWLGSPSPLGGWF